VRSATLKCENKRGRASAIEVGGVVDDLLQVRERDASI
jgi:hypothetical protein